MSQWTHLLGVIRYDSMNLNMYPQPENKEDLVKNEMDMVAKKYNRDLPNGSEGPIQIDFNITKRGPTILITGDLRDFGKEDLPEVLDWVNDSHTRVANYVKSNIATMGISAMLILRDVHIKCDVESDNTLYVICQDEDEPNQCVVNSYSEISTDLE